MLLDGTDTLAERLASLLIGTVRFINRRVFPCADHVSIPKLDTSTTSYIAFLARLAKQGKLASTRNTTGIV